MANKWWRQGNATRRNATQRDAMQSKVKPKRNAMHPLSQTCRSLRWAFDFVFFFSFCAPRPPPRPSTVMSMVCVDIIAPGRMSWGSRILGLWNGKQNRRAARGGVGVGVGGCGCGPFFSNLPRVAPTTPAAFVCWILGLHMGTNEPHMTHLPACLPMGGGPDHGRRVNPSGYLSWAGPPLSVHVHVHVHVHGPRCPTVVTIIRL